MCFKGRNVNSYKLLYITSQLLPKLVRVHTHTYLSIKKILNCTDATTITKHFYISIRSPTVLHVTVKFRERIKTFHLPFFLRNPQNLLLGYTNSIFLEFGTSGLGQGRPEKTTENAFIRGQDLGPPS